MGAQEIDCTQSISWLYPLVSFKSQQTQGYNMNQKISIVLNFLTATLIASYAAAAEKNYSLKNPSSTGITFQIGYSAGVHDGTIGAVSHTVVLDEKNNVLKGDFEINIDDLHTGNETRDCHMREALGLNYDISAFPEEHVCDKKDLLPNEGPDAVTYPTIHFSFTNLKSTDRLPEVLVEGQTYTLAIQGVWSVHGVTQDLTKNGTNDFIPVQIKVLDAQAGELQLISKFEISLKDYGVIVKPFKFGPIKVGVADKAKVTLNMKLLAK